MRKSDDKVPNPLQRDTMLSRRTLLKLGSASLLSGCGGANPQKTAPKNGRPNIVLIVMDTVRRDHLSAYGYSRETSPFLTSLLSESTQFTDAYSTSCWTFPAHASMFTGLHSTSHGARWGNVHIDETLPTLPAILQRNGYKTLGVSENGLIGPKFGYDHGWDVLENPGVVVEGDETAAVRRTRDLLQSKPAAPFFLFVNLLEAHLPYRHAGPFKNHFLSDPAYEKRVFPLFLKNLAEGKKQPNDKNRRHIIEHYDAEIRFVDSLVEKIVHELKTTGVWDDTLFIVVSDHGEGLGEHDHYDHQFYLYENLVRIPAIVRWPGRFAPGVQAEPRISLVDLFPTILGAAEIDAAKYPSSGRDLSELDAIGNRPIVTEYYLHQAFREPGPHDVLIPENATKVFELAKIRTLFERGLKSILVGDTKLIRGDNGSLELYDLAADRSESVNLAKSAKHAEMLANLSRELDGQLDAFRALRDGDSASRPLTESTVPDLKALGYLGN